ncbi:hypothetical protein ACIQC7_08790 [Kitasatospora sp. NPDC088556]|uniref:hypothetical protein n=1 Tax=Kitasatospora sp. NPDC088556 TaxID=3364076 RepID=UPI00381C0221
MNLREKIEEIITGHNEAQANWERIFRKELRTYDPENWEQPCEDREMGRYDALCELRREAKSADLDVYIDELNDWLRQNPKTS